MKRRVQSAATGELLPPPRDSDRDIWDDVLPDGFEGWEPGSPADPADVLAESRHLLGIGPRRVRYRPDGPDVSTVREALL